MSKNIRRMAVALIIVGLLASCYLNYFRLQAEAAYKSVQVLLDYDELRLLAKANEISMEALAARLKQSGATGVVIRERTLEDLQCSGDIVLIKGSELALLQKTGQVMLVGLQLKNELYYVLTRDKSVFEAVYTQLSAKRPDVAGGEKDGVYYLSSGLPLKDLSKLGVGFIEEDLRAIARSGLAVVPRIREWTNMSEADIDVLAGFFRNMPGLAMITFNDPAVPGSNNLPYLAGQLNGIGKPLGAFEFYAQTGFGTLARYLDKNVVRVHAISENDMPKYNEKTAVDRFNLAVSERNIRALYVRLFGLSDPSSAQERAEKYIAQITDGLKKEGFSVGAPEPLAGLPYSRVLMLLAGLGVIGGGLLLLSGLLPAAWARQIGVLGILGLVGWAGALYISPALARKAFALLAVIIFPIIGTAALVREEKRGLPAAALTLVQMSAVSFVGALLMTGLLAEKSYMLTLDIFSGVKVAHLVPLLVIPLYFLFRGTNPVKKLKEMLTAPVLTWHAALGALVLVALAVYIIRTGNEAAVLVTSWEMKLRDLLDLLLGVRPRNKEFLIGHPAMLLLLYYGYEQRKLALLLFAVIGQISLVNTYAHIHTPLLISLLRSLHGLWLGLLIGAVLIVLIDLLKTWLDREALR